MEALVFFGLELVQFLSLCGGCELVRERVPGLPKSWQGPPKAPAAPSVGLWHGPSAGHHGRSAGEQLHLCRRTQMQGPSSA